MINVKAVVEMPKGTKFKYEKADPLDPTGLKLDRVLKVRVPENYGYIPNTLAGDGDPLDVFILTDEPLEPLTSVEVEVLGMLRCEDGNKEDHKVLVKIVGTNVNLEKQKKNIIKYLRTYKKGFLVLGQDSRVQAMREIFRCQERAGLREKNY